MCEVRIHRLAIHPRAGGAGGDCWRLGPGGGVQLARMPPRPHRPVTRHASTPTGYGPYSTCTRYSVRSTRRTAVVQIHRTSDSLRRTIITHRFIKGLWTRQHSETQPGRLFRGLGLYLSYLYIQDCTGRYRRSREARRNDQTMVKPHPV